MSEAREDKRTMDRGWVKSYRKIEDWEWYKEPTTAHLFQHLVRRANREGGRWRGIEVPKGCLVTSIRHLAEQTGLSVQQVRTSLKHLLSSGDITQSATRKYTLIKVKNYCLYQGDNTQNNTPENTQLTQSQHTANTQLTTNKNIRIKELKNKEDIYIAPSPKKGLEPSIIEIPTNRNGEYFEVTQKMIDEWQELYPNVNVLQELRNAKGWSMSNPAKRKTARGMPRFINAWLSREQDKNASYNPQIRRKEEFPF